MRRHTTPSAARHIHVSGSDSNVKLFSAVHLIDRLFCLYHVDPAKPIEPSAVASEFIQLWGI
jgi:hypothetical protein